MKTRDVKRFTQLKQASTMAIHNHWSLVQSWINQRGPSYRHVPVMDQVNEIPTSNTFYWKSQRLLVAIHCLFGSIIARWIARYKSPSSCSHQAPSNQPTNIIDRDKPWWATASTRDHLTSRKELKAIASQPALNFVVLTRRQHDDYLGVCSFLRNEQHGTMVNHGK